ncbi:hypothetical protein BY458DRAFT_543609 [Sporodiniella umbellata]|nr:hypothetical protein BY458DRAFT_543609 [Sporodiniella umbellata]
MSITRDEAICIYFYVDFTNENVQKYQKKFEKFKEVEICWNLSEKEPVVVSKKRIRGDPHGYRTYPQIIPPTESSSSDQKILKLTKISQVKDLINTIYCYKEPEDSDNYSKQTMSTEDIFQEVQHHTTVFTKKSTQSFVGWCSGNNLEFLNAKTIRTTKISRELYVMKDIHRRQNLPTPVSSGSQSNTYLEIDAIFETTTGFCCLKGKSVFLFLFCPCLLLQT